MTIAYKGADIDAMAVQLGMAVSTTAPLSRQDRTSILTAMVLSDLAASAAPLATALSALATAVQAQVAADGASLAAIAAGVTSEAGSVGKLVPQP